MFAAQLAPDDVYGRNLDALWDILTGGLERPVSVVWTDSSVSREKFPETFNKIVRLLRMVEAQDVDWGLPESMRFRLDLR